MVVQQDKPIQINQWVFIYSQSKVIKASSDNDIDSTLEVVELNGLNCELLWQMVASYPETVTANELLLLLDDDKITRNKLYQAIAKLRRIFDDRTHHAIYIETVPKKGYCWLAEPFNREETSNTKICDDQDIILSDIEYDINGNDTVGADKVFQHEEQINNNADQIIDELDTFTHEDKADVPHGLLDKNIFEDLGFISNDSELETTASQINDKDTSIENEHKVKRNNSLWLFGIVLLVIVITLSYLFYKPKPPVIFVASDKLYIAPLVVHEGSDELSTQSLEKIQWWIEQKLQHIPAMTVLPTTDINKVPRINGVVERTGTTLKITLTFLSKQKNAPLQKIFTVIKEKDELVNENQTSFNHQLNNLMTGTNNKTITNDNCNLNSFVTSLYATDDCLIDTYQQYILLLTGLNSDVINDDDDISVINSLKILANKTIKNYKDHSLGYQMMASYYQELEEFDKEHEQLLLAMERNQNNPIIIKSLSESYRLRGEFHRSLLLVDILISRDIDKQYALYWKAYDLVSLGYLYKAQKIIGENDIELSTLEQKVYFFGINYNQLNNILNDKNTPALATLNFINKIVSDDVYCQILTSVDKCIEKVNSKVSANLPITQWKAAVSYLLNDDIDDGYKLIRNDAWLTNPDNKLVTAGDRIFFIPSLANMLIKMGERAQAKVLLDRLITFIQTSNTNHMYTLTLAETYALLGHHSDALDQMSKLLAQGWLPNAKYQIWSLADNPNFEEIKHQWQFLNLVELIENRRQLIKLRVTDLNKTN